MIFKIIISNGSNIDKSVLYSWNFEIKQIKEDTVLDKRIYPTLIYYAIENILSSNIPEQLEDLKDKDLEFSIIGKGINVSFDLK